MKYIYEVPSQLAWLDLLKSEEMDGSTVTGDEFSATQWFRDGDISLVGTKVTAMGVG